MSDKGNRPITKYSGGFISDLTNYFKLVFRLMRDRRVNPFLKLIPVGTLVYLVNPIDIPGPIDDAAIIGLGMWVFVELCPPEVVDEHRRALAGTLTGQWRDPESTDEGEVIEAQFKDDQEGEPKP